MSNQPITPLRQRMIEDMTIRRLKASTQDFYQRAVARYAQHFRRSPGELDYAHVRQYQLHLAQAGCQPVHVNHMMTALRFFYKVTMPDILTSSDTAAAARIMQAMMQMKKIDIQRLKDAYVGR